MSGVETCALERSTPFHLATQPNAMQQMLKEPELEGLRAAIQGIEGPARSDFGHLRAKIEEAGQRRQQAALRVQQLEARVAEVAAQVGYKVMGMWGKGGGGERECGCLFEREWGCKWMDVGMCGKFVPTFFH